VVNTIRLRVVVGGVPTNNTWATGGAEFTPGTDYNMEIMYLPTGVRLYKDGVVVLTTVAAINFGANVPNVIHAGCELGDYTQTIDGVLAAP